MKELIEKWKNDIENEKVDSIKWWKMQYYFELKEHLLTKEEEPKEIEKIYVYIPQPPQTRTIITHTNV